MSGNEDTIRYSLDLGSGGRSRPDKLAAPAEITGSAIPRIARLMALAIRFEATLRQGTIGDYAELARLGNVTRARITQIMKLRLLAPDIQEQLLFLQDLPGINERNLRSLVNLIDWNEQRRMFQIIRQADGRAVRGM